MQALQIIQNAEKVTTLGEYLIHEAKISEDQLEDALVHQKYFRGKIGTHLVELSFLGLVELENSLSNQFEVFPAQDQDLEDIDDFCRHQLPIEIVERYQILPLKFSKGILSLAMTNPGDQRTLHWLSKMVSCKINIHSISEIRFHYYLYRHFNRDLDQRIRNLFFKYLKEKCLKKLYEEQPKDPTTPTHYFYVDQEKLANLGLRPLEDGEELSKEGDEEMYLKFPDVQIGLPLSPTIPQKKEYEPEFADFENL